MRGSGKRGKGGSVWFELWSGGAGKYWRAFILSCVWGDSKYIPLRQKLMWGVYGGKEAAYRIDPENEFSAKISSSKVLLWSLWKKFETNYNVIHRQHCRSHRLGLACLCKDKSSSFTNNGWGENDIRACVFGVFRALDILNGMFKVFRWNGLKILIPKHMWKSIIGPREQI